MAPKIEYKTTKMYHPSHSSVSLEGEQMDRNEDGSFDVPVHLTPDAVKHFGFSHEAPKKDLPPPPPNGKK